MNTMNKAFLILASSMTAFVADSATVYKAYLNTLDLDSNPQVVTNVTFEGIPQPSDVPTKTSDLTNDGDGTSPFATIGYVDGEISAPNIAMFLIPINSAGDETRYTGIELKCSTNNFADVTYFASAFTDEYDGMSMFVQNVGDDKRAYTRVSGTGTEIATTIGNSAELVILVSVADCKRNDGDWLRANNDDAAWTFTRLSVAGREQNPDGSAMWRTCAPIRWSRRMPEWATQSE